MPHGQRLLITAVAAAFGGWAGLMVIGGGAAGVAWIYLFGDDPWPRWGEWLVGAFMLAGMAVGAIAAGRTAWRATARDRQ